MAPALVESVTATATDAPAKETAAPTPVVVEVNITAEERASGVMSRQNVERAVVALAEDGVVVLNDAVDHAALDAINGPLEADARFLRNAPGTQFNYDKKAQNILQHMRPDPASLHPAIHANPFATQVCAAVLGPNPVLRYHKANTNFPGDARQPVHSDVHYAHPRACFALAVNMIPRACGPFLGSTELWLGTHTRTTFADQTPQGIRPERLAERRRVSPPVQPDLRKGAILVRDMRLWHAGMPNHSADTVRVMLNLIYFADWYRCPMQIRFPAAARDTIAALEKQSRTTIAAQYVGGDGDEAVDVLTLRHTHDFGQDGEREHWGRNRE